MQWLIDTATAMADRPWLQAVLLFLATFVMEDPATITGGFLWAEGYSDFGAIYAALLLGILVSDTALYVLGRVLGPQVMSWKWIPPRHVAKADNWLHRNYITTIAVARFLPGLRMPTYILAGVLRGSLVKFILVVGVSSAVWIWLVMLVAAKIGAVAGHWRWWALAAVVVGFGLYHAIDWWWRRRNRAEKGAPVETVEPGSKVTEEAAEGSTKATCEATRQRKAAEVACAD